MGHGLDLRSLESLEEIWDASSYLALVDRHNAAGVQYDVVSVLELVGLVLSSLKDHAVYSSSRAVISPALDPDPVAPL
jgi:hypothetical protein